MTPDGPSPEQLGELFATVELHRVALASVEARQKTLEEYVEVLLQWLKSNARQTRALQRLLIERGAFSGAELAREHADVAAGDAVDQAFSPEIRALEDELRRIQERFKQQEDPPES